MRLFVTSADGTRVCIERTGRGPALILVGTAGQDRTGLVAHAAALSPQLTVYNYDRRGRGDSTDTAPYAVQREIEDLAAVRAAVDGPVAVFGGSSGAILALNAAAAGPDADRLVLREPPCVVDDSRPPVPPEFADKLAAMIAAGRRSDAIEAYMVRGALLPADAIAALRETPMWAATEALAHALAYDAAVMDGTMTGRSLTVERWARATMPALVLSGGASPGVDGRRRGSVRRGPARRATQGARRPGAQRRAGRAGARGARVPARLTRRSELGPKHG
jgi:pimeloyl-ACP methyl ester carboxylesterase